jgi:hypothetical protein
VEADADGVEKLKVLFGRGVVLVLRCAVGSVLCWRWFSRGCLAVEMEGSCSLFDQSPGGTVERTRRTGVLEEGLKRSA